MYYYCNNVLRAKNLCKRAKSAEILKLLQDHEWRHTSIGIIYVFALLFLQSL